MTDIEFTTILEKITQAIYDAPDPFTGDSIARTLHMSTLVEGETVKDELNRVRDICRAAAYAALKVINEGRAL